MTTIVLNKQTLLDVALQEYGTIEAVFALAIANGLSITTDALVGTTLDIPIAKKEQEILAYYKKYTIEPSTGITNTTDIEELKGIGSMAIGTTFIVR